MLKEYVLISLDKPARTPYEDHMLAKAVFPNGKMLFDNRDGRLVVRTESEPDREYMSRNAGVRIISEQPAAGLAEGSKTALFIKFSASSHSPKRHSKSWRWATKNREYGECPEFYIGEKDEAVSWLRWKLEQCGFAPDKVDVIQTESWDNGKGRKAIVHAAYAACEVKDVAKATAAYASGIGDAKYLGLGMIANA